MSLQKAIDKKWLQKAIYNYSGVTALVLINRFISLLTVVSVITVII